MANAVGRTRLTVASLSVFCYSVRVLGQLTNCRLFLVVELSQVLPSLGRTTLILYCTIAICISLVNHFIMTELFSS